MKLRDFAPDAFRDAMALIASAVATGCGDLYGPVPTCNETDESQAIYLLGSAVDLASDGGFSVEDASLLSGVSGDFDDSYPGEYGSCRQYCSQQVGLVSLYDCQGPTPAPNPYTPQDADAGVWKIECDGRWVSCTFPVWISGSSGRTTDGIHWGPSTDASSSPTGLADYVAGLALGEAAAVHAFRRLAREIAAHGGPPSLVFAAERAALEEIRHTRLMAGMARRLGARVVVPAAPELRVRPLGEVASENAREGCARETLGAIVVAFQGRRAHDPRLRRAFASIARDEAGHAALSWRVAAWAERTLGERGRRQRREVVENALADIEAAALPPPRVRAIAGLPSRTELRSLLRETRRLVGSGPRG